MASTARNTPGSAACRVVKVLSCRYRDAGVRGSRGIGNSFGV